jgi:hypothetical protein
MARRSKNLFLLFLKIIAAIPELFGEIRKVWKHVFRSTRSMPAGIAHNLTRMPVRGRGLRLCAGSISRLSLISDGGPYRADKT